MEEQKSSGPTPAGTIPATEKLARRIGFENAVGLFKVDLQ